MKFENGNIQTVNQKITEVSTIFYKTKKYN